MPTPAERSALLFVAAVAALGVGVRGCQSLRPTAPGPADRERLAAQLAAVDSAIAAGGAFRTRRPRPDGAEAGPSRRRSAGETPSRAHSQAPGQTSSRAPSDTPGTVTGNLIDPDRASAAELDLLPGIGPALAARIVADRDSLGPFGSLEGLQRVRGIGPALSARLAPRLRFSGRAGAGRRP